MIGRFSNSRTIIGRLLVRSSMVDWGMIGRFSNSMVNNRSSMVARSGMMNNRGSMVGRSGMVNNRGSMVDNRGSMVARSMVNSWGMIHWSSMVNSRSMIHRSSMIGRNSSRSMDSCHWFLIASIAMNTLGGSMRLAADRCMVSTMRFVNSMAY